MKAKTKYFVVFIIVAVLTSNLVFAQQKTTIDDILNNPGAFIDVSVTVEGVVSQYVPATSTSTSYFILMSDYGNPIRVNTSLDKPSIGSRYSVSGIVYSSSVGQRLPFISEKDRTLISGGFPRELIYVLAALLLVLIVLLIFYLVRKKKAPSFTPQVPTGIPAQQPASRETIPDLKTIKINLSPPTMRLIPALLEITSQGADKGKQFSIAGFPGPTGSVVTIGRSVVTGEKAFSHIHLSDEYRTVSRNQAELIERKGDVFIKNIGETNPTRVNGVELEAGRELQLNYGDKIQLGELELIFKQRV